MAPPNIAVLLGRSVVVADRQDAPPGWETAERVRVDDRVLAAPGPAARRLYDAWLARQPVVVELAVDPAALTAPEASSLEPWQAGEAFTFVRERLAALVWANSYDARNGTLVWWWARKAARISPGAVEGGPGDLVLGDGTPVAVDGGPRGSVLHAGRLQLPGGLGLWHRETVDAGRCALDRWQAPADRSLAGDQLAAVVHGAGPARVIAPAGSGKTRTLVGRLRHLLDDRGWDPRQVCAVAYNTRAAEEMVARIGDRPGLQVRTLHAFAFFLLRTFGPSPRVLDEREVRNRLGALTDLRGAVNTDPAAPWLDALAQVRLGLVDPAVVEESRDDVPGFADVYARYVAGLRADHAVDFDAMVFEAVRLLLSDADARLAAQRMCRHLCVDEFQDLTPAFLLFVRLLAGPFQQVFGVGDDDQTIYSHVGASPAYLVRFADWFWGAAPYALEVNYRCPPTVVEAAARVLALNTQRVPKTITAGRTDRDADALSVLQVPGDAAAAATVAWVRDRLAAGARPSDVAVLARVNAALLPVQVLLAEAGVPFQSSLTAQILSRTGLRAALSYLRLAASETWVGADVAEIANRPSRRIPARVRDGLARQRVVAVAELTSAGGCGQLVGDLAALRRMALGGATTQQLLRFVRDTVGLGSAMASLDGGGAPAASHIDDVNALIAIAASQPDPATFEPWLRDRLSVPSDDAGVRLASIHRTKGLEFDEVAVVGVARPLFPHRLAEDGDEEGERRVFHVALTRARRRIVLVADAGADAPFLDEIAGRPRRPVTKPAGDLSAVRARPERASEPSAGSRVVGTAGAPSGLSHRERRAARQARIAAASGTWEAAVGASVTAAGGFPGRVVELASAGVVVAGLSGGRRTVAWGAQVVLDGGHVTVVRPTPDEIARRRRVADRLERWRAAQGGRERRRPDAVLDDAALAQLAALRPTDDAALARVRALTPQRREAYGPDLLAEIAEV